MIKSLSMALAAAFLIGCGPSQADEAHIRKTITTQFPGVQIESVKPTPYAGLFEVYMDGQIVYVDPKADFAITGDVLDLKSRRNLTRERLNQLMAVEWGTLPLDRALKTVKGDGSRQVVVFSDVDCPFCRRLEAELAKVDNVTVYTLLYPIESLHPRAVQTSRKIWCAKDKQKAWDDYLSRGVVPDNDGNCANPVDENIAYGRTLHVGGTPTLFFPDGQRVPGFVTSDKLEVLLDQGKTAVPAKPAKK